MRLDSAAKLVIGGSILLFSQTVRAEPAPTTRPIVEVLDVEKNECFDRASLASTIGTWLGRSQVASSIAVTVRGTVGGGRGVVFALRRAGEAVGERHFPTRRVSCANLTAIVGLAVAMAIDASLIEQLQLGSKPERPPNISEPPLPSSLPRAPYPSPYPSTGFSVLPPKHRPRVEVDLEALGLVGVLPVPAPGAELGGEVAIAEHFGLRVEAFGTSPVLAPVGRGHAETWLVGASIGACPSMSSPRVRLRLCGGAAVGQFAAKGVDYALSEAPHLTWAALTLRFDTRMELSPNAYIRLSSEVFVPMLRPQLEEASMTGAILARVRSPAAGLAVGLGPAVSF